MALLAMIRTPMPQAIYLDPSVAPNASTRGWELPRNNGTPNLGYVFLNIQQNPYPVRNPVGTFISSRPCIRRKARGFLSSRFLPLP
jgi:hypothetical protein